MSDELTRFYEERAVRKDDDGTLWYGTLNDAIEAAAHAKRKGPGEHNYQVTKTFVKVHHSPSHIVGWMTVVDPTG